MSLLPPAEALARMLAAVTDTTVAESVPLRDAAGRTLSADVLARHTQPPFAASAMDGYAVRAADLAADRPLKVIGQAAAGHPFAGRVEAGEAVRIFTGAPVPEGADTILIQENASTEAGLLRPTQVETAGRFIRKVGLDFAGGDALLSEGAVLAARHLGLAASMGHDTLPVRRKPRVGIVSTGDELVPPGAEPGPGQIVSSNATSLRALLEAHGAEVADLGIVPDDPGATREAIGRAAAGADLIITCGGASVGDHDHVRTALEAAGFAIDFWRVALRPGKPFMFGAAGRKLAIGLPGNPVSSYVCALLFVTPVLQKLLGRPAPYGPARESAILGVDLPANDQREDYLRARLATDGAGRIMATPFQLQDSSVQRLLAAADALVIRPAHARAAKSGENCAFIRL